MNCANCYLDKAGGVLLGVIALFAGALFLISGFTYFPFFGFVVALPLLGAAFWFFRTAVKEDCANQLCRLEG